MFFQVTEESKESVLIRGPPHYSLVAFLTCGLQTCRSIYAVTPIPESQDVLQRDGVPDNIKSFYKFNHIWRFRYDRPFHKGTKDKENEFKVQKKH